MEATRKKLGIGVAAVAVAVAVWASGLLELAKEPARLQAALRDLGGVGMLAYVAVFALTQPFGMPGIALCLAASLIWPPPIAGALALTGFFCSSSLAFGFSRAMGRDWVAKKLPPRLRAWDDRIEKYGVFAIIVLRMIFFGSQLVHLLLGISKVRFWKYALGSTLGYLPGVTFLVVFGPEAVDWLKTRASDLPIKPWRAALIALGIFIAVRLFRWYRARSAIRAAKARQIVTEGDPPTDEVG